jgi:hypothetical protein
MTLYRRQVFRLYLIPILTALGVLCSTLVDTMGDAETIPLHTWLTAAGQAIVVLGAGLAQAYLNPPTPPGG